MMKLTTDLYDESIENLCERWRKLQREKELQVQDQLKRIENFEIQKYESQVELEIAEKENLVKQLQNELDSLKGVEVKEKDASREIREIRKG